MEKIAITALGNSLEAKFDLRFGRAEWFYILGPQNSTGNFVENLNSAESNGAGLKAAELMASLGVQRVISGDFGPKAKDLLDRVKIKMVILNDEGLKIRELIEKLQLIETD